MHGHHPEAHNYRPACARAGLAAPQRPSLVIQKIHRLGVGVSIIKRHEQQDGGGMEGGHLGPAAVLICTSFGRGVEGCPLSRAKQKLRESVATSVFDPKRTLSVAATILRVLAENDRTLTFGTPVDGVSL